jgi:hypothetical protein
MNVIHTPLRELSLTEWVWTLAYKHFFHVGFEVLTAVSMKIAVFWVVAPCIIRLMMEAARTSETLVNFYQTTRCYNPEDSNLHFFHGSTVLEGPWPPHI